MKAGLIAHNHPSYNFLKGGGEMGEMIRNFDWSKTQIGPPDYWPQSWKTSVSILLQSRFPMFVWLGPHLNMIYNDAYRIIAGDKHPQSMGGAGKEIWAEIWDIVGPLADKVMNEGEATWSEDQLLYINRKGYSEESYFTFSYSPIIDESGKVAGVFCACTETTEKVLSAKKIAESENNFRRLIMQAPVGICIVKSDPVITEIVNELFVELTGKSREAFEKLPYWEVLSEVKDVYEPTLKNVINTGVAYKAKSDRITLIRHNKEEVLYVNFVYEPLKENGLVKRVMILVIDITEQVLARQKIEDIVSSRTQELAEVNQRLQQNNQELNQFAYIASHDLQEPIRKVSIFTQMLRKSLGAIDERSDSYIEKIGASATRMLALIRDVLTFSQLSKESEKFEPVDLLEIFHYVESDFELMIEQKKAVINCKYLPTIDAIPLQMTQLFSNLVSNSLKFAKKEVPPVIDITVSQLSSLEVREYAAFIDNGTTYYNIRFCDNGIGFGPQNAEQIFNIFQRLHGKSEYPGTGIGLAICKKITNNHFGTIKATSEKEYGAIFNIILPKNQPTV